MSTSPRPRTDPLSVRVWSQQEFAAGEGAWSSLLARSAATPLFMSWQWHWRWWQQHSPALRGELLLLAAYQEDGRLVGIAPLYRHGVHHRYGMRGERIELIGTTFRNDSTIFTEYLDFIVDSAQVEAVSGAFARFIREDPSWSDFVIGNTPTQSIAARCASNLLGDDCYVRTVDPLTAHAVRLPGVFADYLAALSPGVRRKVWNKRSRLKAPRLTWVGESEVADCLRLIQQFQSARWARPLDARTPRTFHTDFAVEMARRGALRMSILSEGSEPISAMYNIELNGTEYNLQSGFSPAAAALSPSYLHFGYCLEEACARGIRNFDMLGGSGRTRQYKRDFMTRESTLITVQVVRKPLLRGLYLFHDLTHKRSIPC
jgi:CelD/BcsL family acetyltransferase involved in cellulose biosynthesis